MERQVTVTFTAKIKIAEPYSSAAPEVESLEGLIRDALEDYGHEVVAVEVEES